VCNGNIFKLQISLPESLKQRPSHSMSSLIKHVAKIPSSRNKNLLDKQYLLLDEGRGVIKIRPRDCANDYNIPRGEGFAAYLSDEKMPYKVCQWTLCNFDPRHSRDGFNHIGINPIAQIESLVSEDENGARSEDLKFTVYFGRNSQRRDFVHKLRHDADAKEGEQV
jgi:hypothetical protein